MPAQRWDIFCKVIDNYGDIGVTWRLARQLAAEHGIAARLWVDDLESLERLCPAVEAGRDRQDAHGVEVRRWDESAAAAQPAGPERGELAVRGDAHLVLVHTERSGSEPHIISLRKAERYEARYYFEAVQAELGEG